MFDWLRRRLGPREGSVGDGLNVCAACHEDYVHPLEWREDGETHWWMRLRCGACRAEREVTVTDDVAQRFGRDLDAAEAIIDRQLRVLDCERMALEIEAFAQALDRDLIDADDFARPIDH